MTGLLVFAVLGMVSAGRLGGHHGDGSDHHHHLHTHDPIVTGSQVTRSVRTLYVSGIMEFDRHACIFRDGEILLRGPELGFGEEGLFQISSGSATLVSGHHVSLEGGLVHVRMLNPRDTTSVSNALSRTTITMKQFLQQTGPISPDQGVIEVTAGMISISGTYRNVNSGVMIVVHSEYGTIVPTEPFIPGLITGPIRTVPVSGIMTFDGHACVARNGEILMRGVELNIGEAGLKEILSGTATLESGQRVSLEAGLVDLHGLHPRNTAAIRNALSRTGITLEQFLQHAGPIQSQHAVIEVRAGILSISGTYRNINSGVLVVDQSGQVPTEPAIGHSTLVTETVAPETLTVSQPVTLIKTSTHDEYITITSPVYNSVDATFTNFIRRTVTVPEEQVIRSPVAGRIVVSTIAVPSHTILTLTDTATNYFVKTNLVTVTSTLQHLSSNFAFRTVTVNNIITSTVVHTITRTSIATVYVTNYVTQTVYSTIAITVTLSHGPATTTPTVPIYTY